jgi:hypothetical protein
MYYIDDVPPALEVYEPADGSLTNRTNLPMMFRAWDNESAISCVLLYDAGRSLMNATAFAGAVPFRVLLTDGPHDLALWAVDDWSNDLNVTVRVTIDSEPPEIVIGSPENGTLTNLPSIAVTGTIRDCSLAFIQDRPLPTDAGGHFEVELELSCEGDNRIIIRAVDDAGNARVASVVVIRDTIAPVIRLEDCPALTNSSIVRFRGWTDGDSVTCLNSNETRAGGGAFEFPVTVEEGKNLLTMEAFDRAGNWATISWTCISDQHLEFAIIGPENGASVEDPNVRVTIVGERGLTFNLTRPGISLSMNLSDRGNLTIVLGPLIDGANQFLFDIRDEAGNAGTYVYVLNKVRPPHRVSDDNVILYVLCLIAIISIFVSAAILIWRGKEVR